MWGIGLKILVLLKSRDHGILATQIKSMQTNAIANLACAPMILSCAPLIVSYDAPMILFCASFILACAPMILSLADSSLSLAFYMIVSLFACSSAVIGLQTPFVQMLFPIEIAREVRPRLFVPKFTRLV